MDVETILVRVGAAVLAGGLVGLEREISGKEAGLRTNILICVGASVMAMIGVAVPAQYAEAGRIISDPQRIAAGVITGIGFLGAGAILRSRGSVRGLTTAATIWVNAAIGLAIGSGYYSLAALASLATVGVLLLLVPVERWLATPRTVVEYELVAGADPELLHQVEECARRRGAEIHGLQLEKKPGTVTLRFDVIAPQRAQRQLASELLQLPAVRTVQQA